MNRIEEIAEMECCKDCLLTKGCSYRKDIKFCRELHNSIKTGKRVAEEIKSLILEHTGCEEYHYINGEKHTCLDVVMRKIEEYLGKEAGDK